MHLQARAKPVRSEKNIHAQLVHNLYSTRFELIKNAFRASPRDRILAIGLVCIKNSVIATRAQSGVLFFLNIKYLVIWYTFRHRKKNTTRSCSQTIAGN